MAEYIERAAAINEVAIRSSFYDAEWGNKRFTPDDVKEILQSIPAAAVVERKTGKWNQISPAGIYECNQCGQNVMTSDIEAYKFCHGCGAKMEVPDNV